MDEAGAAARDIDQLADEVGINAGDEVLEAEIDVVDAGTELGRIVIAQIVGLEMAREAGYSDYLYSPLQ